MADPGFSGGATPGFGAIIWQDVCQNCIKMKEIVPRGGAHPQRSLGFVNETGSLAGSRNG